MILCSVMFRLYLYNTVQLNFLTDSFLLYFCFEFCIRIHLYSTFNADSVRCLSMKSLFICVFSFETFKFAPLTEKNKILSLFTHLIMHLILKVPCGVSSELLLLGRYFTELVPVLFVFLLRRLRRHIHAKGFILLH